jgi:hypothetical protein
MAAYKSDLSLCIPQTPKALASAVAGLVVVAALFVRHVYGFQSSLLGDIIEATELPVLPCDKSTDSSRLRGVGYVPFHRNQRIASNEARHEARRPPGYHHLLVRHAKCRVPSNDIDEMLRNDLICWCGPIRQDKKLLVDDRGRESEGKAREMAGREK